MKKYVHSMTLIQNNLHSWHKVANILYIDNPVGTGFSHFKNNKTGYFPGEETGDQVERELAELLLQFLKLFPTYVGSTNAQLKPKTYLFGESYGGAYVVSLGTYILANDKYKQVSCHLTGSNNKFYYFFNSLHLF